MTRPTYEEIKAAPAKIDQLKNYLEQNPQDAEALSDLGICYLDATGVEKDSQHALKLFQQGADLNHASCTYHLTRYYDTDVSRNIEILYPLYEQGAYLKESHCRHRILEHFYTESTWGCPDLNYQIILNPESVCISHNKVALILARASNMEADTFTVKDVYTDPQHIKTSDVAAELLVSGTLSYKIQANGGVAFKLKASEIIEIINAKGIEKRLCKASSDYISLLTDSNPDLDVSDLAEIYSALLDKGAIKSKSCEKLAVKIVTEEAGIKPSYKSLKFSPDGKVIMFDDSARKAKKNKDSEHQPLLSSDKIERGAGGRYVIDIAKIISAKQEEHSAKDYNPNEENFAAAALPSSSAASASASNAVEMVENLARAGGRG